MLVDIDPGSGTLDPNPIKAAITPKTKAVIVSHIHGGMADVPRIVDLTWRHKIAVIEDACQMPGAKWEDRLAGTMGDVGVFSFGGSKIVTTGRGGALITKDASIAQRIRLYRIRGNNAYPLSELQAAAILPQWQRLQVDNERRSETVASLIRQLPDGSGLVPFRNCESDLKPAYYKLGFWYQPEAFAGLSRDLFARAMRAEGIAMDVGFRALHLSHSKRRFRGGGTAACCPCGLPRSDAASSHALGRRSCRERVPHGFGENPTARGTAQGRDHVKPKPTPLASVRPRSGRLGGSGHPSLLSAWTSNHFLRDNSPKTLIPMMTPIVIL